MSAAQERRERVLQALGLTPLWVRRNAPAPEPVQAASSPLAERSRPAVAEGGVTGDRASEILRMDWTQLRASTAACTACVLHQKRKQAVLGVGDVNAEWLFVGEGPGADEDEKGEPFVGQAGKLLDNMLAAIGLKRGENVYIANVVKCRPPQNRTPTPIETDACWPFLLKQVQTIQPKVIVTLGGPATKMIVGTQEGITRLRGTWQAFHGVEPPIPVMPTFHPPTSCAPTPRKTAPGSGATSRPSWSAWANPRRRRAAKQPIGPAR